MAFVETTVTSFREKPRWAGIKEVYVKIQIDGAWDTSGIEFDVADYYVGSVKAVSAAPFLDDNSDIIVPVVDEANDVIMLFRGDSTGLVALSGGDTAVSGNAFYATIVGVGV